MPQRVSGYLAHGEHEVVSPAFGEAGFPGMLPHQGTDLRQVRAVRVIHGIVRRRGQRQAAAGRDGELLGWSSHMFLRGARTSRIVLVPGPLRGPRRSPGDMSLSALTIHRRYAVVAKTVRVRRRSRRLAGVYLAPHGQPA